jgi:Holliday junction resolvase RusA-like endonuclease
MARIRKIILINHPKGGSMKFTIPLTPVTKKNHGQIIMCHGKPIMLPSKQYAQYENDCKIFLPRGKPIDKPINIKAVYYMPTRRKIDLINLHSALHDVLVKHQVIADDNSNIIASTDGSRVEYDKENPRTEVEITEVTE